MTGNLAIWNALEKTDPNHTKGFNRAGGFKGTAIKPIWIIKRLTEQFGPCGVGWGTGEPVFQVVPCEGEILVFCTVTVWHGSRENVLCGVGGDKVQAKRKDGHFCDDEAFKKAFTDAVNNAFKFIGVGADVHMGLFDDDKYVSQARADFAETEPAINDAQFAELALLLETARADTKSFCDYYKVASVKELFASRFDHARAMLNKKIKEAA